MAKTRQPVVLRLKGSEFACTVCGNRRFIEETVVVKTADTSLFSTTAAPTMKCMVCTQCGYVHHFMPQYAMRQNDTG